MKNTDLKKWQFPEGILEKRLVWDKGGPDKPAGTDKPKEAIDATEKRETMDKGKLDRLMKVLDHLTVKNGVDVKVESKGKINAVDLKKTLSKSVDELAKSENIKNLDIYLMNGLLENFIKPGEVPSQQNEGQKQRLTTWLQKKEVVSFKIVDGFWTFKSAKGDVPADFSLDAKPAAPKGAPPAKPEVAKGTATVLSAEVGKGQATEAQDKVEDTERLKIENLSKAKSKNIVELKKDRTMDDVLKELESGLKNEKGKPAIKTEEMKPMLAEYINAASGKPASTPVDQAGFNAFMDKLAASNWTTIFVRDGKIKFGSKDGKTTDGNPLNLGEVVGNDIKKSEIYAHPALREKGLADAKEKGDKDAKEKEKAATDVSDKPNRFSNTEKVVQSALSGKEKVEAKDLPKIDARYLEAFDAMVNFKGTPLDFKIPFNDGFLKCNLSKDDRGTYILKYGNKPNANIKFQPTVGSKDPNGEMIKAFASSLNYGEALRQIQVFNIKDRKNLESFGLAIDNGPSVEGGIVEYELNWKTGAFEKDPHIFIETLPHGELKVTMKKADIGFSDAKGANNDEYVFTAGGMPDMVRILGSLKKWHENPQKNNPDQVAEESDRRFLQKGAAELGKMVPEKAGKLLKVDSVNSNTELDLSHGVYMRFDWMQKLDKPQLLQIVKTGDRYRATIEPSGKLLGIVKGPISGSFTEMMNLVAAKRSEMVEVGGEEVSKKKVNKLIEDYNNQIGNKKGESIVLKDNVKIISYSGVAGSGPQFVELSMGEGMAPARFDLQIYTVNEPLLDANKKPVLDDKGQPRMMPVLRAPGFREAAKQGYLLEAKKDLVDKPVDSGAAKPSEKPVETISNLRKDNETAPKLSDASQKTLDSIVGTDKVPGKIKNPAEKPKVTAYLKQYLTGYADADQGHINTIVLTALMKYTNIKQEFLDGKVKGKTGDDQQNRIDFLCSVIEKPTILPESAKLAKEQADKDIETKYAGYPKIINLAKAYINMLFVANAMSGAATISGKTMMDTLYPQFLKAVDAKKTALEATKPTLLKSSVDSQTADYISVTLKNPYAESLDEWNKQAAAEKDAKAKSDAEAKVNAEFLEAKTKPNGMPFEEFEKQKMAGLAPDAWKMLKGTNALLPKNIFLSNIPGNTPISTDRLCFNVSVGPEGSLRPYTLVFTPEYGMTTVKIAPGWNNVNVYADLNSASKTLKDEADAKSKADKVPVKGVPSGVSMSNDPVKLLVDAAEVNEKGRDLGVIIPKTKSVPAVAPKADGAPSPDAPPPVVDAPAKPVESKSPAVSPEIPGQPGAPKVEPVPPVAPALPGYKPNPFEGDVPTGPKPKSPKSDEISPSGPPNVA